MTVQKAYTESNVLATVQAQKAAGKSLRRIAAEYGKPVTHGDIGRILHGIFPKGVAKRSALGLPVLLPAPACPHCGRVHLAKRCPVQFENRPRKSLYDYPVNMLRKMFEERTEF